MKKNFALIKIMLVASAAAALCACGKQPVAVEEPPVEVVEETVVEESASEKNQPEVIEPEVTETEEAEKLDETLAEEDIQSLELVEGEEIIEDQLIDDLYYDADIPEDFEFAAHDEDYVEPVVCSKFKVFGYVRIVI